MFWHFSMWKKENSNSNYALIRINYYLSGVEFLYLSLAGGGGGGRRRKTSVSKWFQKKNLAWGPPIFWLFQSWKNKEKNQWKCNIFQYKNWRSQTCPILLVSSCWKSPRLLPRDTSSKVNFSTSWSSTPCPFSSTNLLRDSPFLLQALQPGKSSPTVAVDPVSLSMTLPWI